MNKEKKLFSIREAAEFLRVSIDTLRRWDSKGKFKAIKSSGGHRYYSQEQLKMFGLDLASEAFLWIESEIAPELKSSQYCYTQDIFRARLDTMASEIEQSLTDKKLVPLIVAITGEIGNNSFDHNFGNWPNVPGVFFSYNTYKKEIVLADRGLGIKETLLRVRPDLKDDLMALKIAFTEHISARAPEQRGNGLKFVNNVATKNQIGLLLYSGLAVADIAKKKGFLRISKSSKEIKGTLTKIIY